MSLFILYVGKRIPSRDTYRWQSALRKCGRGSSWAAVYIVYMYLYLYVGMYICIERGMYIYIRIHAQAHAHTHTHIHTRINVYLYVAVGSREVRAREFAGRCARRGLV